MDHKNLEFFITPRVLNCRQTRWNMSLSCFGFIITYRPGKQQGLLDALSRRSYFAPKQGEAVYDQQQTILQKPEIFCLCAATMSILVDLYFLIKFMQYWLRIT
jgi:hypothetical protein